MAEAVRQVAISAILVSQHTVVNHKAIVALQQDRERQQQEQVQRRRRRRRRQRSCWVRDWLLHGERLRHSQYYTLLESLREKDSGSEFLAGCFDQTAVFLIRLFALASCCHISLRNGVIGNRLCLLGRGWFYLHLPLPLPPPFLSPFGIMLDVYTTRC